LARALGRVLTHERFICLSFGSVAQDSRAYRSQLATDADDETDD
jgi:hypothetical protein